MQMNFDGDMIFVDIEQIWGSEIYFIIGLHGSDPFPGRILVRCPCYGLVLFKKLRQ
jgi:hypothetical protein